MNQRHLWVEISIGLLSILLTIDAAKAADCGDTVAPCACGDTVIESYTLSNDLVCPTGFTGNALTIGADSITINGGGFEIEAPDAHAVIHNGQYSHWTLQNIAIQGGFFGIQSDGRALPGGVRGISILNVDTSSSIGSGQRIRFLDTHESQVVDCQADGGDIGIYNLNGDQNQYRDTSASWLPTYGPLPPDTGGAGQNQVGVQLIGVRNNLLEGITVHGRRLAVDLLGDTGSPDWGFRSSDDNIIQNNDLSGNGGGVSFRSEGHGNQILHNDLSGSAVSSIGEAGGSLDLALQVNGDSGIVIEGNDYSHSFNGISLSNIDAEGRTLIADAQLTSLSGNYGLRLTNVHDGVFERIEIDRGARQSLWWSGGSSGNTFREVIARGHTFGLLSQDSHNNLVVDSDFSWTDGENQSTGIDLRLGSASNVFDNITVHGRQTGARIAQAGRGTAIRNSDLSRNHNCVLAQTQLSDANQQFHNLRLNDCTGNALTASFDNLLDLRSIDFSNSFRGLSLSEMSGVHLDGQAQGLDLSMVLNRSLFLFNVHDSSFTNMIVGGSRSGVELTTSHGNLFSGVTASWIGPTRTGDGFFLNHSARNIIQNSSVENRDLGLQVLSGSEDNVFQCNTLGNNRIGALNNLGAHDNRFQHNLIADNQQFGAQNTDTAPIDMSQNYWGALDGPSPSGSGNAISGPINFLPFFDTTDDLDEPCGRSQPAADLELLKTAGCDDALPGDLVVYTLTVSNHGPDQATGVVVEDHLPAEVSWVSDTCGAGPPNGPWTWDVGPLAVVSSETCDVTVGIPPNLEQPVEVRNTASVTGDGIDPDLDNNTALAIVFPRLDPSLVGWWPLDEASGSVAYDVSGNGGEGTLQDTPQWAAGQQAGALDFDGEDDHVEILDADRISCSSLDLVDGLTIALWVRPDTFGQTAEKLVSKDNAYEFEIGKVSPETYSVRLNNVVQGSGETPVEVGVWQHLAITWDGFIVRYYYNGLADGSASFNGTLDLSSDHVGLGARPGQTNIKPPAFFFDGRLDDIRLYRRALSNEEIATLVDDTLQDIFPPVRSSVAPVGVLPAGTTQTTLSLTTDEIATCRYSADADVPFADMGDSFAVTGGISHSTPLAGLVDEQVVVLYVRCQDALGNTHSDDLRILFGVGSTDIVSPRISYWSFDEGSGCQAADEEGANLAILGPSCPTDAPQWGIGQSNTGLDFGGGAQEALVAQPVQLSPLMEMTLSAWIRHPPTGTFRAILDQRDAGSDGYDLYLNPSSQPFLRVNSAALTGHRVVADDTWHHVVGVFDGTQLRLYVDGLLDASVSFPMTSIDTNSGLYFGRHFAVSNYPFLGSLDEVQIYDRALSDIEVVEVFYDAW